MRSGRSAAVITAFTPFSFSALDVSILLILAWACGLLRMRPTNWPGHVEVRAVAGAARHLVDAVGTDGAGADGCEIVRAE